MMQQPICPPDQVGGQQNGNQQMMLCPVRVVYETQILMPPGEQFNPNQTIYLNPQNTPPWAQNRQVQNQVVYVQQMPNNIMTNVQRPMDQNQMYIQQNFQPNYQQMMANQIILQNQQDALRGAQVQHLANLYPNMIGNVQQNLGQIQLTNEAINQAQLNQIQQNNMQAQNQMVQVVPNNINVRPMLQNAPTMQPVINQNVSAPRPEIQRHNVGTQMQPVQQNLNRPQIQPMIIQNPNNIHYQPRPNPQVMQMPNQVRPNQQVMTNQNVTANPVQNYNTNQPAMVRKAPVSTNNVNVVKPPNQPPATIPTSSGHVNRVVTSNVIHRPSQNVVSMNNANVVQPRAPNQMYSYRPIQPRPQMQQVRNTLPNLLPINANPIQVQNVRQIFPNQTQMTNVQYNNASVQNSSNLQPNTSVQHSVSVQNSANIQQSVQNPQQNVNAHQNLNVQQNPNAQYGANVEINANMQQHQQQSQHVQTTANVNVQQNQNIHHQNTQQNVNIQQNTNPNFNVQHSVNASTNTMTTYIKQNDNNVNRKRKSESPDEIHKKKLNATPTVDVKPIVQQINPMFKTTNTNESRVNTAPVHRFDNKMDQSNSPKVSDSQKQYVNQIPHIKVEPNTSQSLVMNIIPTIAYNTAPNVSIANTETVKVEQGSDKLVRNTVYTQARGRLLNDKEPIMPTTEAGTSTSTTIEAKKEIKLEESKPIQKEQIKTENKEIKTDFKQILKQHLAKVEENKMELAKNLKKEETKTEPTSIPKSQPIEPMKIEVTPNVKSETVKPVIKPEETTPEAVKSEPKDVKVKTEDAKAKKVENVVSMEEIKGNEIHFIGGSVVKEEKSNFILTHVLDGYVIQESNLAFPIRKPLKERSNYPNTKQDKKSKDEDESKVTKEIRDNSKVLNISHLNLNEELSDNVTEDTSENAKGDNPFVTLKPSTIETWTVDELSAHLAKYNWTETTTLLKEHEIDGESLMLVSRNQLIKIGIDENHADMICEFVKS